MWRGWRFAEGRARRSLACNANDAQVAQAVSCRVEFRGPTVEMRHCFSPSRRGDGSRGRKWTGRRSFRLVLPLSQASLCHVHPADEWRLSSRARTCGRTGTCAVTASPLTRSSTRYLVQRNATHEGWTKGTYAINSTRTRLTAVWSRNPHRPPTLPRWKSTGRGEASVARVRLGALLDKGYNSWAYEGVSCILNATDRRPTMRALVAGIESDSLLRPILCQHRIVAVLTMCG